MRLCQHPEFEQLVLQADAHFANRGLRPAMIEKDYYVTEALRAIAEAHGESVIFKGGTSLSKGWNLIERFSEDIDIFLDPESAAPALRGRGLDRALKALRDTVATTPGMTSSPEQSQTIGGFGRSDVFTYDQRFGGPGEVAGRVLLEAGTASGREPTETVQIVSYVARFLSDTGISLGATDEGAFPMRLLHFRRTFVEKMFAIHGKVQMFINGGTAIGPYARHYYDLAQLAALPEIEAMLTSSEYEAIRLDYDRVSRTYFPRHYFPPEDLRFKTSPALFPEAGLSAALGREYEAQCRLLCYGTYPPWTAVLDRFKELQSLL